MYTTTTQKTHFVKLVTIQWTMKDELTESVLGGMAQEEDPSRQLRMLSIGREDGVGNCGAMVSP